MTLQSDKTDLFASESVFRTPRFFVLLFLLVTSRIGIMCVMSDQLTDDRDAYLAIARQLTEGNGFRSSVEAPLTAYRPPLYPLAVSFGLRVLSEPVVVGFVNLACSIVILTGVWKLACQCCDVPAATVATFLVIVDPLLFMNAVLPMTEIMFSALVVWIVWLASKSEMKSRDRVALGVTIGLAALCRPTIWAFVTCYAVVETIRVFRDPREKFVSVLLARGLPVVAAIVVVVSPWVIRNFRVFDAFIPMTTHGGYTLLLANNPMFYEEVVEQGWRHTWQGDSLSNWQQSLEREMMAARPPISSELERNQWMTQKAIQTIRQQPATFLQSVGVRFLRFWNPAPISTPGRPVSTIFQWVCGLYSIALFLLASFALIRNPFGLFSRLSGLMILSLTLVHMVFWSNLRMRTPLESLLILLSVSTLFSRGRRGSVSQTAYSEKSGVVNGC